MNQIVKEYADWLKSYYWDYFFTVTFRTPRREPYYAMKGVWNELKKNTFTNRAFIVCEPHRTGDLHIHGLIGQPVTSIPGQTSLPWEIHACLFKRFGRTKVEACNSRESVTGYCAKYIMKEQSLPIDHYGVFGAAMYWKEAIDISGIIV